MITYSVAALLLAYLRAVQAQATICLATYGGVATRYISRATELKQFFLELPSSWSCIPQRPSLPSRYFEIVLTSCESVYLRQDEVLPSKSAHYQVHSIMEILARATSTRPANLKHVAKKRQPLP